MNEIDKTHIIASLIDAPCGLQHEPGSTPPTANNAIIIPLGYKESELITRETDYLTIPVCLECIESFGEWVILYCIKCQGSRWSERNRKNKYHPQDNILLLNGCPGCNNKFGGLYFTDVFPKNRLG